MSQSHDLDNGTWRCMTDAPKDGAEVELLIRHDNWRHCNTDEDRANWEGIVRAKWIPFNGGGWTWEGMCGRAWAWRPLVTETFQQCY